MEQPLGDFFRSQFGAFPGELQLQRLSGGYSNLTYLARFGKNEVIVRSAPDGRKAAKAHDMVREARVLDSVSKAFRRCPKVLVICDDETVIGKPFFVMERLNGVVINRKTIKAISLSSSQYRRLCEATAQLHGELHRIDWKKLSLPFDPQPVGYIQRQLNGWSERYDSARTFNAPSFLKFRNWLQKKMPAETGRASLIHNDFKIDNLVVDPENNFNIVGLLDWEMTTVGDPLMDLGSSLAYWVEKSDPWHLRLFKILPSDRPGALTRKEWVEQYLKANPIEIDNFDFYYGFGLFRLAVIAQQIYYRYYHRQTRDRKFRNLIFGVHALNWATQKLMKGKK